MKTNEIKKGARILLRNGWEAIMADNMKGNIRVAQVFGYETETGSIYSHDIAGVQDPATLRWLPVEYTPAQLKLRKQVESF